MTADTTKTTPKKEETLSDIFSGNEERIEPKPLEKYDIHTHTCDAEIKGHIIRKFVYVDKIRSALEWAEKEIDTDLGKARLSEVKQKAKEIYRKAFKAVYDGVGDDKHAASETPKNKVVMK